MKNKEAILDAVFTPLALILLLALGCQLSALAQPLIPVQRLATVAAPSPMTGANGSVTLYWQPTTDTNVTGYSLGYGTNENALNTSVGVGMKTNVTLRGLMESTVYHFELVALNGISPQPPNRTNAFIQPKIEMETHVRRFSVRLIAGRTNVIQASTNLVAWQNILTNTAGGLVTWLRTNVTQEFYRVKP